jgi:hypothetical protein
MPRTQVPWWERAAVFTAVRCDRRAARREHRPSWHRVHASPQSPFQRLTKHVAIPLPPFALCVHGRSSLEVATRAVGRRPGQRLESKYSKQPRRVRTTYLTPHAAPAPTRNRPLHSEDGLAAELPRLRPPARPLPKRCSSSSCPSARRRARRRYSWTRCLAASCTR